MSNWSAHLFSVREVDDEERSETPRPSNRMSTLIKVFPDNEAYHVHKRQLRTKAINDFIYT